MDDGVTHTSREQGMTLRDYFAAQALNAMLIQPGGEDFVSPGHARSGEFDDGCMSVSECVSIRAYKFADAMLAERAKEIKEHQ